MYRLARSFIPHRLLKILFQIKYRIEETVNSLQSGSYVFRQIYVNQKWGINENQFFSGQGSISKEIIQPYINYINGFLISHPELGVVVDLGCGDLNVAKGFLHNCRKYIGVDIVPELLQYLRDTYEDENVEFHCLDIVKDNLPQGDICLIRQVFQHLSNKEIKDIVKKLDRYAVVFVTEHYPSDDSRSKPNVNIAHGSHTRANFNSAVYLDEPPFNIPKEKIEPVLIVNGAGINELFDQGLIRTYKIDFKKD